MKISFCANEPKYNLSNMLTGPSQTRQEIPALSDEQVRQVNETRNLPEDYYVLIKEFHGVGGRPGLGPSITITRGLPKAYPAEGAQSSTTLPDGFAVENYKDKTYLKKEGTKLNFVV